MQSLVPFFSLDSFAHPSLWREGDFPWSPLHTLVDYLLSALVGKKRGVIPPGVHLTHPELVFLGEGTVVEPGVMIEGPCILGKGCAIRHGALLRGGVLCGDFCVIGHGSEVKHSILLDEAKATHLVYVGDSILGNRVNLGAGVKCANLRLDRKEVVLKVEGEERKTGLKKLGSIVGDGAQLGCNCVLNPGTMVGREVVVPPLVSLSGFIPPKSRVRSQHEWSLEPLGKKLLQQADRFHVS